MIAYSILFLGFVIYFCAFMIWSQLKQINDKLINIASELKAIIKQ
jgi:hypothetical protein